MTVLIKRGAEIDGFRMKSVRVRIKAREKQPTVHAQADLSRSEPTIRASLRPEARSKGFLRRKDIRGHGGERGRGRLRMRVGERRFWGERLFVKG